MAWRASRQSSDTGSRCPACSAPVVSQLVGHTAALKATVDLLPADEPRPYGPALTASTADDLVWCLPRQRFRPLRLRWTTSRHPPDCPHQHLTAHRCPPAEPTTLF
jgi:hypothetical protein